MKLGAEDRKQVAIAGILAVLALVVLFRAFRGSAAAPANRPAAQAQASGPQARRVVPGKRLVAPPSNSLDPTLNLELLQGSEETEYEGKGRNIFRAQAEAPPIERPVAPVVTQQPVVPQGPPPPPPINLKFFGFASKPGETKRVFLSEGDDVFIAAEGEIVNRRYKVLRIGQSSVDIEDVLHNNRQTIPLTSG